MKNSFLIAFLISCCSCCDIYWEEGCKECDNKYGDRFCLEDGSGYKIYDCNKRSENYREWVEGKTVMCEKDHKCRCWQQYDWYEKSCECYYSRLPPSFPPTGVIQWNGTFLYDDNWIRGRENPRKVYIPGEIHKDARGRLLHKWTSIGRWVPKEKVLPNLKVQFKILIPNGDKTYTKFTGVDDGSKLCSKDVVKYESESDLNAIWQKHRLDGKPFTLYDSQQKEGSGNVYIEIWRLERFIPEWYFDSVWTVEYDNVKGLAIPLRYKFRSEDGAMPAFDATELNYRYESLNEDDESFNLEDYCVV